jgi:hypothetical protein
MLRRIFSGAVAVVLLASATRLDAQIFPAPALGEDLGQVTLHMGLLSPMTTFDDPTTDTPGQPSKSSFSNGFAIGATVTAWPGWPLENKLGIRASLIRSALDGQNSFNDFAAFAVNDPTTWTFTTELVGRLPMGSGFPYASLGIGIRHYTWKVSVHEVSRFKTFTGTVGYEFRPIATGPFGFNVELRGYRSDFRAFGIDDGTWEDGPYGGKVGTVPNNDLLFIAGASVYF